MTFHSFPPHPAMAAPTAAPAPAVNLDKPLISRFPWCLTIAGKAIYYDAAGATSLPSTLSEALILLWICAHPTELCWQSRAPEHEDGVDTALPLGLDLVELRRQIAVWADQSIKHSEDSSALLLAQSLWIHGHATFAVPVEEAPQKKTELSSTGQSPTCSTSLMETQQNATMSSTEWPSETPMPPFMQNSSQQGSLA